MCPRFFQSVHTSMVGCQALEMKAGGRVHEMLAENRSLRKELTRVETLNNNLQGYGLDDLLPAQLSDLVVNLTQVQLFQGLHCSW
jgi:hypothetical protein